MTIESFRTFVPPLDESKIENATVRWNNQAETFCRKERRATISRIAIGIIAAWGILALCITLAVKGGDELSTLGIILSTVSGLIVPPLTGYLISLASTLSAYRPFKYNLENPETLRKIKNIFLTKDLPVVHDEVEGKTCFLGSAGVLSSEHASEIQKLFLKYEKQSEKMAILSLTSADEEKIGDRRDKLTTLYSRWNEFQKNELLSSLPVPSYTQEYYPDEETTPLLEVATDYS